MAPLVVYGGPLRLPTMGATKFDMPWEVGLTQNYLSIPKIGRFCYEVAEHVIIQIIIIVLFKVILSQF